MDIDADAEPGINTLPVSIDELRSLSTNPYLDVFDPAIRLTYGKEDAVSRGSRDSFKAAHLGTYAYWEVRFGSGIG